MVINGRQSIVIRNVRPQVNDASCPARVIVKQAFPISADVFTYGQAVLQVQLLLKKLHEKSWRKFSMQDQGNDHWEFLFKAEETGLYQFMIQAWVNPLLSWQKELIAKQSAGQELKLELLAGAALLEETCGVVNAADKKAIRQKAQSMSNEEDFEKAFHLATTQDFTQLISSCYDKKKIASSGTFSFEVERLKAGFSSWYELFPRSASPEPGRHGTFNDVKELLPRLAEMGFDTLYLPPVHPIGELKRKGRNNALTAEPGDPGCPWAIGNSHGGHKALHPELGNLKDFRSLIKAAAGLGIEIAMDIALQCAPDHPYVKAHPEWFRWRPDGTVQYAENPPKKYEDILPLNFETEDREGLWQELKSIFDFWIVKGIRIFRVDNPHTKSFAFWAWVIAEICSEHPEVIFLSEAFTRPRVMEELARIGFNQSYTYFTWRHSKQELETYLTELTKTDLQYYFRPNFWPNTPDILPPELVAGGENMHLVRLILAATLSSNYGIYGPVYEFGITHGTPGKEEYHDNEKYEIRHWDWTAETRIGEVMSLVNRIRHENPALQRTNNLEFVPTDNEQLICYVKNTPEEGNTLIIVVNLDPHHTQSGMVKIPLETLGLPPDKPYALHDLLSQDRYEWKGASNYVQLNPWEMPAHILKLEKTITQHDPLPTL
jgi:starch synthase (maltosyl-transferring)